MSVKKTLLQKKTEEPREYNKQNDTVIIQAKALAQIRKSQDNLVFKYYNKKDKSLILDGVSLALPSRYEALLGLLSAEDEQFQSKIKTLGFWNCNVTNQKFSEILTLLSE